ncbi:MAG: DUF4160 domain-containing protein [Chthoniobacteraceae bacterium]
MPKLYEYVGLLILFYSNEHEPIHVHGVDADGRESKAEIIVENGKVKKIRFVAFGHVPPLTGSRLKDCKALVKVRAEEIVQKWIDFFVFKKLVKMVGITKRVK